MEGFLVSVCCIGQMQHVGIYEAGPVVLASFCVGQGWQGLESGVPWFAHTGAFWYLDTIDHFCWAMVAWKVPNSKRRVFFFF